MAERFNQMPRPEPVWIALGIGLVAVALSLGPKRGAVFLRWLVRLTDLHESHEQIVAFGLRRNHNREMSQSIRGGVAWMRRLIRELEAPEDN